MKDTKICVIGLGYVGLPLARLFSTKYPTVGFDMNAKRCEALMAGHDATLEVADDILQDAINNHGFVCTSDIEQIRDCNFYVVAVPTPVDSDNNPDLTPLVGASTTVGKVIGKGDVVVYESTVYPGVTEDECIPVVEKVSGLKMNVDFYGGYSPERINPGDKVHTVEHIKKITSGSTPEIGEYINKVYSSVITAGTHLAPTIKVAEAARSSKTHSATSTLLLSMSFQRFSTRWASTLWMSSKLPAPSGTSCLSVRVWWVVTALESTLTIWHSAPSATATIRRLSLPAVA